MGFESSPVRPPSIVLDEFFVLERARLDDAAASRRFALDPHVARFFGWTVELRKRNLTIRRRSNGEPVGSVELRPRTEANGEVDVSYMVAVELRGQGLAPMALEALLAWGKRELGVRRAHLACHVENTASLRVAEKCAFVFVGRVDRELRFHRDMESHGT